MAWSAQFTESSAENSSITYTPESKDEGVYSVAAFTALQKGIYRFDLYGSGGANGDDPYGRSNGGKGGRTSGYLQLESGQTIYVGAGGLRCAAFVHSKNVESLAATQNNGILYFVAGGGGNGGRGYRN